MSTPFNQKRRQQFLTEVFYQAQADFYNKLLVDLALELNDPDNDLQGLSIVRSSIAEISFQKLCLSYTAGEPVESLRGELEKAIVAYENYQKALGAYEEEPFITPFTFRELDDYERCMQLTGLCYLLHRRDLLVRIAALMDTGAKGLDSLYEDLMSYEFEDRVEVDALFWKKPYIHLLHALYKETNEESLVDINDYVNGWYANFKYAPWHDGHLRIDGTEGDYFGYWAFEAGAVAYLLGIEDDSSIKHMVYPRDMVEFARNFKEAEVTDFSRMKVPGGQACPQSGYWYTPAQVGSRRYFKAGDVMPELGTDYGATIWEWDESQEG